MESDVDDCPYRDPLPETASATAECRLLQQLSGVAESEFRRVSRETCVECRRHAVPTADALNPVVASLLHALARRVAALGGVAGCDRETAARLEIRAEEDLFLGWGPEPRQAERNVDTAEPLRRTRGRASARSVVGLIGWNTPSGLGSLNRELARNLPIDRWLIPAHSFLRELPDTPGCRIERAIDPECVREFLRGLDWLLFCEHPYLEPIVGLAHEMGIRVACVPMWEHLDELSPWIRLVDLMICPTRFCHARLVRCRERLPVDWELALIPWPIDVDRFPFRPRTICRSFLFIHGFGGMRSLDQQSPGWDGRKGLWIIAEAARLAPTVPIVVRSQTANLPPLPANVEVRCSDPDDPAELFNDGDICVQPSRWEGLGLPLLECQASGLPLITTDAPPMNEHHPFRVVPAAASRARLNGRRAITSHEVDPAALAAILNELHGAEISAASASARRYVESEHSWAVAGPRLLELLSHRNSAVGGLGSFSFSPGGAE